MKLARNEKYILGCSFGPDSMALLGMLLEGHYEFIVCFCNYHLRDESDFEEKELKKFLEKKNIKYYIKSLNYDPKSDGNMEAWAREKRYDFFKEIALKTKIRNVLIGHNYDDLIETFILQDQRNSVCAYYGLKNEFDNGEIKIIRPLLAYRKKTLLDYCKKNNIPFAIDKSNFDLRYKRNKIRSDISKLKINDLRIIEKEINRKNKLQRAINEELSQLIIENRLNSQVFLDLDSNKAQLLLIIFFNKFNVYKEVGIAFINDLKTKIKAHKYFTISLSNELSFIYQFDELVITKIYDFKYSYNITLNRGTVFKINTKSEVFRTQLRGKALFVRPVNEKTDLYKIDGKVRNISNMFKAMKLPREYRKIWPGIYDFRGKLLYIPRYQKEPIIDENSVLIFDLNHLIK
ncbi:MAG TPA: tRNA lysidine(34) synthetase TilS [Candidatus Onthovivens sp.]|nr:tRNA lysidine(34) synthetase TilS [Candidatus Onthovivens sp.]